MTITHDAAPSGSPWPPVRTRRPGKTETLGGPIASIRSQFTGCGARQRRRSSGTERFDRTKIRSRLGCPPRPGPRADPPRQAPHQGEAPSMAPARHRGREDGTSRVVACAPRPPARETSRPPRAGRHVMGDEREFELAAAPSATRGDGGTELGCASHEPIRGRLAPGASFRLRGRRRRAG